MWRAAALFIQQYTLFPMQQSSLPTCSVLVEICRDWVSTGPGAGRRERRGSINDRRSGKGRASVAGEGGGIVLLAGADGGGAVGVGVVGGKGVFVNAGEPGPDSSGTVLN